MTEMGRRLNQSFKMVKYGGTTEEDAKMVTLNPKIKILMIKWGV